MISKILSVVFISILPLAVASAADPVANDMDPCELLTAEDAGKYLDEVESTEREGGNEDYPFRKCKHDAGLSFVMLAVAGGLDADQFEQYVREDAEAAGSELEAVEGIGDRAFLRGGDFLWVHSGEVTFYISAALFGGDGRAAALDLAKSVEGKL